MGACRSAFRVLVGKVREEDHLEYPGMDGRLILKWTFEKWVGGREGPRLDESGSGQEQVAVCCQCGNELSGSIKCGEFCD
jgi:hypothetical protein